MVLLLALLIGVVAGLRVMTALAAASWAAYLGWFEIGNTWLTFMGHWVTPWIFSVLALIEFVTDQLPATPSRTVPMQFAARIIAGALCGATLGASAGMLAGGLLAGTVGAVIGTLGGRSVRGRLAAALGKDRPAALLEDAIAIIGACVIVAAV
jgi:uncharacterized membrane protein